MDRAVWAPQHEPLLECLQQGLICGPLRRRQGLCDCAIWSELEGPPLAALDAPSVVGPSLHFDRLALGFAITLPHEIIGEGIVGLEMLGSPPQGYEMLLKQRPNPFPTT